MAEGLATDADGGISLIRVGSDVFHPPALPAPTKRAFLVSIFEEGSDEFPEGVQFQVQMEVLDPEGKVLTSRANRGRSGTKPYPQFPASGRLPLELELMIEQPGTHQISVDLSVDGHSSLRESVQLHVAVQEADKPEPAAD